MAAYYEKLRENLSCPVCFEIFDHEKRLPKGLPCYHTLCFSCLDSIVKKNLEQNYLCPMCQAKFSIPTDGVKTIPNNTSLMGMLDLLPPAEDIGADGNESLANSIRQNEATEKKDKLVELPKCVDHGNAVCIIYCMECHVPLCTKCMTLDKTHNGHQLEDLASMPAALKDSVEMNVKAFKKVVAEFDQFSEETLSTILKEKSEISMKIKEEIDLEAERFYQKCKGKVDSYFNDALQRFNNFTSEFNEKKADFEGELQKIESNNNFFDANFHGSVSKLKQTMTLLEFLNAKSPDMKSLSDVEQLQNSIKIQGYFESKNTSTETPTEANDSLNIPDIEGVVGGQLELVSATEHTSVRGTNITSEGTLTDELTLTSIPIIIPSGTVDLHLHITDWKAFVHKGPNSEEICSKKWHIRGALWNVFAGFKTPDGDDEDFTDRRIPALAVGASCEKKGQRWKYNVDYDILFKNYRNGFWVNEMHISEEYTPKCRAWYDLIFSKDWLLPDACPYVKDNAMHICVLLTVN